MGDVVLLTDDDLGLAERVALVESVTVGDDQPVLGLVLPHRLVVGECARSGART